MLAGLGPREDPHEDDRALPAARCSHDKRRGGTQMHEARCEAEHELG